MNFRIITKNQAADPEIGFLTKLLSKPDGYAPAMSTALELRKNVVKLMVFWSKLRIHQYN